MTIEALARISKDGMNPDRSLSVAASERTSEVPPLMDLAETEDHYLVTVDLPGLDKPDLEIEASNGQIQVVSGDSDVVFRCRSGLGDPFGHS